jgi:hypothetical protein
LAGHRGYGKGQGPARGPGNGNPAKPLVTTPELQRARAHKRWSDHRERAAEGPEAVAAHARMCRLKKIKAELKRAKRAMRSIQLPPRVCSEGT